MFSRTFVVDEPACPKAGWAMARVDPRAQPALWTGGTFSAPQQAAWSSGFAALDAELPGRGWMAGGLIEILQDTVQEEGAAGEAASPVADPVAQRRLTAREAAAPEPCGVDPEPDRDAASAQALAWRLLQRWKGSSAPTRAGPAVGAGAGGGRALELVPLQGGADRPGEVWRLLLPALPGLPGGVTLIGPPAVPHAAALAQAGLGLDDLVWVQADTPARRLWAAEQVLRAGLEGATLVWLPWATAVQLRRLQMAALASPGLVFVMRPASVATESSPAPLRLLLSGARHDTLGVRVFKRRGPPMSRDLQLTAWPPGLADIASGQAWMTRQLHEGWAPQQGVPQQEGPGSMAQPQPTRAAPVWPAAEPGRAGSVHAGPLHTEPLHAGPEAAGPVPARLKTGEPEEASHVVAGLASA